MSLSFFQQRKPRLWKLLPCFFKYLKSFHEDLQDSFLSQLKLKKYF